MAPAVATYKPRDPSNTVLYKVVAEHLETLLAEKWSLRASCVIASWPPSHLPLHLPVCAKQRSTGSPKPTTSHVVSGATCVQWGWPAPRALGGSRGCAPEDAKSALEFLSTHCAEGQEAGRGMALVALTSPVRASQ